MSEAVNEAGTPPPPTEDQKSLAQKLLENAAMPIEVAVGKEQLKNQIQVSREQMERSKRESLMAEGAVQILSGMLQELERQEKDLTEAKHMNALAIAEAHKKKAAAEAEQAAQPAEIPAK